MLRILPALLIAAVLAAAPCGADDAREIKIGFLTDLSSIASPWGVESRKGAELAAEELATRGERIKLIVGDHKFKPVEALSEVKKMIAFDEVDAIMIEFSPTVIASSEATSKARILTITNAAAVSHLATNPYAFKAYLDYEEGCAAVARRWRDKGIGPIGVLKASAEFGELCLQGVKREDPSPIVADYQPGDTVQTQVLALKRAGVKAVMNGTIERDIDNMLLAMTRLQWNVPIGNAESDTITDTLVKKHGAALSGATMFGFPPIDPAFLERFDAAGKERPYHAVPPALSYVHINQLVGAVKKCAPRDVDCQMRELAAAAPEPLIAFDGWKSRRARYRWHVTEWTGR